MLLKDYLPNLNKKFKNLNFSGLAFNSKDVKKNYIFIAIKGDKFDGNNYINDAVKNGAKIKHERKRSQFYGDELADGPNEVKSTADRREPTEQSKVEQLRQSLQGEVPV